MRRTPPARSEPVTLLRDADGHAVQRERRLHPTGDPREVIMIETSVKENVPSTGYVGVLDDLLRAIDGTLAT